MEADGEQVIGFKDIIGQDEAVNRLRSAIRLGRLPHALLFGGPVGVGRRTLAGALAGAVLCPNSASDESIDACGRCEDCRLLESGSHPDLHMIYKELAAHHPEATVRSSVMQELGVPIIRHFLISAAMQSPTRGKGKVFVVQEAELMSDVAQNALLKTLEEPPPGVIIILLCQRPEELLPTTLSRCSMIRLGPLPRDLVAQRLVQAGTDEPQSRFWADFTMGSLGESLRLAGKDLYQTKMEIVHRLASMGRAGEGGLADDLAKTMEKLAKQEVKDVKDRDGGDLSAKLASRKSLAVMLRLIACAYQDAMRLKGQPEGQDVELVNSDQAQDIAAIAAKFTQRDLADIIEQLSEYERLLWRNVSPKLVWDNVVITCASAAPLVL